MRFLPVNLTSFLVELPTLAQALGLFSVLKAEPLHGVEEMIPAARTVLIRFAPYMTSAAALVGQIMQLRPELARQRVNSPIEIQVDYNGEDLPELAELTGLSVAQIINRHTARDYVVAFCGFAPGFGYLIGGDPVLRVPRRQTPRTRIPAGAVGLAGEFTGVYPRASPGGWQLIGTTELKMWDLSRTPSSLFQPGVVVRFRDRARCAQNFFTSSSPSSSAREPDSLTAPDTLFTVLAAPVPALFQDLGRFGQTAQGVSHSGVLDRGALRAANRLVGNDEAVPVLELTGDGFSFRCHRQTVIGFTGAPCDINIRTLSGRNLTPAVYTPVSLAAGDVVTLSTPQSGFRSYLSVRGGFAVAPVLGSASTDTLSCIGPAPICAGARLAMNGSINQTILRPKPLKPVSLGEIPSMSLPQAGEVVWLDVTLGPRADWFTPESLEVLSQTAWEVTPRSNRVGLRLQGDGVLARVQQAELPSEACVAGALEVPPDGKPVLLLADHPLTGGYPVIGVVADHHLDLAGQIPVGAKIRFRLLAPFAEITPFPAIE